MSINIKSEKESIQNLNEMFVNISSGLTSTVENSIFYTKLKQALYDEIVNFTKEKIDLRNDLLILRANVGEALTSRDIKDFLNGLKEKYNNLDNNIGIEYHIEVTRVDYGVPVFVIIKRDQIYAKKLVFRFKKANISSGLESITQNGLDSGDISSNVKKLLDRFVKE